VLSWFRSRAEDRRTAIDLYGAIVAQARRAEFFARHGVEDTPEGRTSMIIVLAFPVLDRLQAGDGKARRVARLLAEAFVTDIDDCLREMGVGDLSVPKKVKRAAQALGERCLAYRAAIRGADPLAALARELASTVPGLERDPAGSESLARFALAAHAAFARQLGDELLSGRIVYPAP
jgi:cytochrome b pre-mRNA-processing protein 3